MTKKKIFVTIMMLIGATAYTYGQDKKIAQAEEILSLIGKENIKLSEVKKILDKAKENTRIKKIKPPEKELGWEEYKNMFLQQMKFDSGAKFFINNKEVLEKAEVEFGVDKFIIVSILGIETDFCENLGSDIVLDSLYTYSFINPKKRTDFYKKELAIFVELINKNKLALGSKGSYAGATGCGQFMPSSYKEYGIDYNKNKKINLSEKVDAIGSIANYLNKHGWQSNQEYMYLLEVTNKNKVSDLDKKVWGITDFNQKMNEWLKEGLNIVSKNTDNDAIRLNTNQIEQEKIQQGQNTAYLFKLKKEKQDAYMLGMNNFRVVTKYNPNSMYATAVFMLSERIKQKINNREQNNNE